ncbi:MAG TPA: ABC transporter ATP-binding protein [Verrucomicrobiae bacterium]|jgi:ABC-type Fe3+/spermidine/putrescine transport system ATPase subunit|nr:ABC transporter ATP-binding protein [Verrucomicrobiae bacterium]
MSGEALVRLSEVRMEGVGKRARGGWAVQEVSLSVLPGEIYTLLGPPASGKTTLLRLLAGFERPDAGHIVVDDAPIDAVPARDRNIGMVFGGAADHALWPHMTVGENVAFGLRQRGARGDALVGLVTRALARVGLAGVADRRPRDLRDMERLRAALARALATEPRLLLLDEPVAALEAPRRAPARLELARLLKEAAITTIYATRDGAEALAVSTRIAVLTGGRIVQEGKPEDVYWRPRRRAVAELAGGVNLVPVRVVELREMGVLAETDGGVRVPVGHGGHPWTVGKRGLLCLRPEALRIDEAALVPGGIPGTVQAYVFEGGRALYDVAIPGAVVRVEMLTTALTGRGFKHGDRVKIEVSPETSVLLPAD